MQRNRALIIAATVGVLAIVVSIIYMKAQKPPKPPAPQKFSAVFAKQDIYPRTVLDQSFLEEREVKAGDPAVVSKIAEAAGKVTLVKVAAGAQLRKDAIETAGGATFEIPEGRRAWSMVIDPSKLTAGLAKVGDHVDAVVTYAMEGDVVSRTVAKDAEVLAVQPIGPPPAPPAEGQKAQGPPPAPTQVRIVLAVTPEEAQALQASLKKGEGSVDLMVRNPRDILPVNVEVETWEHPHAPHVHRPNPAKPAPDNLWKTTAAAAAAPPAAAPAAKVALPPPVPKGPGPVPAIGPAPVARPLVISKPKTVEVDVVRGSTKETQTVPK